MNAVEVENVKQGQSGVLSKRVVIWHDKLGILLAPDRWSSAKKKDSLPTTAITYTESEAKVKIRELLKDRNLDPDEKVFDTRMVFTSRPDKRATKENCADAGLPIW